MKSSLLILGFLIVNSLYAQDVSVEKPVTNSNIEVCEILEIVDGISIASCGTYKGEGPLFNDEGEEFKILKNVENTFFITYVENKTEVGNKLFVKKNPAPAKPAPRPSPAPKATPVANEATQSSSFSMPTLSPFQAKSFHLYLTALNYKFISLKSEVTQGVNTLKYENKGSEFSTLPLDLQIEFNFEKIMLLLQPQLDLKGGEIAVFRTFDSFGVGPYIDLNVQDQDESFVFNNQNLAVGRTNTAELLTGIAIRYNGDRESWSFLSQLNLGYMRNKESYRDNTGAAQSVVIDAGYGEFYSLAFYKIDPRFQIGFGLGLTYGLGTLKFEDSTSAVSDDIDLFGFQVMPLSLKMAF